MSNDKTAWTAEGESPLVREAMAEIKRLRAIQADKCAGSGLAAQLLEAEEQLATAKRNRTAHHREVRTF